MVSVFRIEAGVFYERLGTEVELYPVRGDTSYGDLEDMLGRHGIEPDSIRWIKKDRERNCM